MCCLMQKSLLKTAGDKALRQAQIHAQANQNGGVKSQDMTEEVQQVDAVAVFTTAFV